MKGATAEPSARKSRTPNINITTIIGSSQNFFLTRRNCQSSLNNDIPRILFRNRALPYGRASAPLGGSLVSQSKRSLKLLFRLARAFTRDPVTLTTLSASIQDVASENSRDQTIRRDH